MPVNPYGYVPGGTAFSPYFQQSTVPNNYQIPSAPVQQTNTVSMVLVNSEDEAKNYPLSPGGSVFLMDSNNCFFYTKSVDFSGISSFKKYQFHEVTEPVADPQGGNYITREEFEELKASLAHRNNRQTHQKKEREQA